MNLNFKQNAHKSKDFQHEWISVEKKEKKNVATLTDEFRKNKNMNSPETKKKHKILRSWT